jgi:hypothetical protein
MKTKTSLPETESRKQVKVDPALLERINSVAADDEPIEAIFMLRPDDQAQIAVPPERTEALAQEVLQRVKARVGSDANRVNVFRNLGTFTISAKPAFIRELLAQPEIASALANRQQGEAYIPPHDIAPVKPGSSRGWSAPKSTNKSPGSSGSARPSSSKKTQKAGKSSKSGKSKK